MTSPSSTVHDLPSALGCPASKVGLANCQVISRLARRHAVPKRTSRPSISVARGHVRLRGAELVLTSDGSSGHLPAETARTSISFTIFEGTSEIQRMIIGKAVTGLDVR